MKKVVLGLIIACLAFLSFGFTNIKMEEYNGVYRVPCTVNGAKMKFIFDTGASSVFLSLSMAQYLYDNDYITDEDFIGTGKSMVADGRITDHLIINLKDLEIGGMHFYNVQAHVSESQNAPLLLGQSVIQKFGAYNILGDILTIYSTEDLTSPDSVCAYQEADSIIPDEIGYDDNSKDVKSLFDQFDSFLNLQLYRQVDDIAQQLYDLDKLSENDITWWAYSLEQDGNYNKALDVLNLISNYNWWKPGLPSPFSIKGNIYSNIGMMDKAIESRLLGIHTLKYSKLDLAQEYSLISAEYGDSDQSEKGVYYSKMAFRYLAEYLNISFSQLWNICFSVKTPLPKKVHMSIYDGILNNLCLNYFNNGLWTEAQQDRYRKILARKGLDSSIRYCNMNNLKF